MRLPWGEKNRALVKSIKSENGQKYIMILNGSEPIIIQKEKKLNYKSALKQSMFNHKLIKLNHT